MFARRKILGAIGAIGAFSALGALADPLPADRKHDWTYTGVPGGIPIRDNICVTLAPGVSAATINTWLNTCLPGSVIYLSEGTYTAASLGGVIIHNQPQLTVRGAGPDKTILQGGNIINMGNGGPISHGGNITAGGTKGSFTFTVDSTANLAPGRVIELDREDDPTLVVGPTNGGTRNITQMNVVTDVTGNVVTLRNPLFYDFSTGTPRIKFWYVMSAVKLGLEDLKLDHTGASGLGMNISYCDSCWVKNVDSANPDSYHFVTQGTVNFEYRENYIHGGGATPNNGGINFYGSYLYGGNSSGRIEANIFNATFPAVEMNNTSSGFAILYNYNYGSALDFVSWTYDDNHAPFNVYNLYEGNIGEQYGTDGYYGGAGYGVALRNHFTGVNNRVSGSGDSVWLLRLGYRYNVVGNVIGSAAQNPIAYEGCGGPVIYRLGYPNLGNCDLTPHDAYTPPGGYPDPEVSATLLRWGNYDHFNDATQWNPAEIPAGVAVPGDQIIPNSYVYSEKPSWWPSNMVWPGIGPDISGGNGDSSGKVYKNPANVCWENLDLLNGGAYNYNSCFSVAASCLSSPRGLRGAQSGICAVWDFIK